MTWRRQQATGTTRTDDVSSHCRIKYVTRFSESIEVLAHCKLECRRQRISISTVFHASLYRWYSVERKSMSAELIAWHLKSNTTLSLLFVVRHTICHSSAFCCPYRMIILFAYNHWCCLFINTPKRVCYDNNDTVLTSKWFPRLGVLLVYHQHDMYYLI